MDKDSDWIAEVVNALTSMTDKVDVLMDPTFDLVRCGSKLVIHLVPLHNSYQATDLMQLQYRFQHHGKFLIHLWEDVWKAKNEIVLSRVHSFLGLNKKVFARNTKVVTLNKDDARLFLTKYHLQGFAAAHHYIGLLYGSQLVSVAAFTRPKLLIARGDNYFSGEMIRFATVSGYTVIGGLSKLLNHYIVEKRPNDIMTYADRDWSLGESYRKSGFTLTATTPPLGFFVNEADNKRHARIAELDSSNFVPVFNTGNLKYHLFCK